MTSYSSESYRDTQSSILEDELDTLNLFEDMDDNITNPDQDKTLQDADYLSNELQRPMSFKSQTKDTKEDFKKPILTHKNSNIETSSNSSSTSSKTKRSHLKSIANTNKPTTRSTTKLHNKENVSPILEKDHLEDSLTRWIETKDKTTDSDHSPIAKIPLIQIEMFHKETGILNEYLLKYTQDLLNQLSGVLKYQMSAASSEPGKIIIQTNLGTPETAPVKETTVVNRLERQQQILTQQPEGMINIDQLLYKPVRVHLNMGVQLELTLASQGVKSPIPDIHHLIISNYLEDPTQLDDVSFINLLRVLNPRAPILTTCSVVYD